MSQTYQQTVFSAPVECKYSKDYHELARALQPLEEICIANGGIETVRFLAMRGRDGQYANATKAYLVRHSAVALEAVAGESAHTRVTIREINPDDALIARFRDHYASIPENQIERSTVTTSR